MEEPAATPGANEAVRRKSFFSVAKKSFPFCFGGIWLFCGLPFLIIGLYVGIDQFRLQERFKTEAVISEGMVLTKAIKSNKDSKSYWVSYRFRTADGTVVKNEAQVDARSWDTLAERGPVRVSYLPDSPDLNRIEGAESDWLLALIFTGLGLFFVPIGGLIFLQGLRTVVRELSLQREGATVNATIIDVGPADVSFNGVPQWRIRYRYDDYRGKNHIGESSLLSPEEAQRWKVGDTGQARFDRQAPQKSAWIGNA